MMYPSGWPATPTRSKRWHELRAALPGHGRPLVCADAAAMRRELERAIAALR